MQGHTVATHDFDISSRSFDISSDDLPGGAAPSDASAGGVWEVRRLCAGVPVYTQVCWRIARSNLELSETSLLPGVELRDAALRVSFPSGLLPAVGVAQLNNDALLILFAMHAPPPGGIFVCVLHFELPPDRGLVRGAVTLHDSWFARDPTILVSKREKTYIEPVGKSLGAARTGAFDDLVERVGERMWRTSMLLAGEAAHAIQLPIDERPVERLLTSIFGSVAGKIGLDERVAPRALFSREVSANGSAWQRVCCESDYELELATEDATGGVSSADAPLCSAMDWWLGRLSRPVRFASRHLEEARHALLPDAPSRRLPDAPSLRAGFEARVAQLEAAAAVSASARANFNDVEGQLGESLVHVAAQRRADPYALLAIGALAHARVGAHDGAPTTALLTTARMLLLQRAPSTVEEGIFLGIGDRVLNACGWAGGAWARRVLIPAASTAACALSAADEALDAAAALAPAALVLPQEWHALGNATAQFNACDALLRMLAQAPAPGPWAADEWARKMRERWSLSAEPAAVAAAHALAPFLNAAAAHGATRLSKLARAALLSMRLVQRQGSLAAPNLSSLMNPASRLVVAAELLHRLAVATPSTSAGLASSALEQLLRAAPLPENPGLPLSDASPCVAALLTLALRDVSIAHGDGPTVDGSSGNWPPSLASILYDAKLWRPLAAYLRVLCSPSPVHTLYAAMASLNSRRYEASAELFRLAVERCDSRANVLRGLLLAGGFAEVRSEVGQPVGEDALFDWHLFQFAAAVWRVFKAEGQDDLVVRFSQATLVELVERKATVRWHAPAQCASLATLVFTSHLALGQIKRAFEIIETLERLEKLEEREGPRGAFRERKQACLRSLISTLHSPPSLGAHKPRGALHLLASLTSHRAASLDADPMLDGNTAHGTALSLEEEVHELLLEHARGTAVLPTTLPLEAACTAAAKAAEALITGTPAAPGTTTMVPPSAYEVAYALRIRGKQYQRAAGCQFELAGRLEAEWRERIEGGIQPAGESEVDGRRRVHAETLLVLEALVDALGAAIGALELVESPTRRFVCERIPNRAARLDAALKLVAALNEHRQGEPVDLDERGELVRQDERGAATASRGVPPCSEVLYDAGMGATSSDIWSAQESVHDMCKRLEREVSSPETCGEWAPRQLHTLRQRRALARGRACLLAATSPEMHDAALEALPHPLNARGDTTTAEAAAVLERLLRIDSLDSLVPPGVMDVATDLGLAGVALVAYRLAYQCVRLDEHAASGGRPLLAGPTGMDMMTDGAGAEAGEGGESHCEWLRLRHVLRHDCERLDYTIGTAAAAGALAADPGRKLPQWLLAHIHPPLPGEPLALSGDQSTARAPFMLRLSVRIAKPIVWTEPRVGQNAPYDGALPDNAAVERAANEEFEPYQAAQPRLEMRGVVAWGGDACVTIPYASPDSEAHDETIALISKLRQKDPGCRPLRRNPAALVRLLLATHEESRQLEPLRAALTLVRAGCEAALEEKRMTQEALNKRVLRGQLLCDSEGRDRWVTCGLIDALHAAVANLQGVRPYKADGNARKENSAMLQDELSRCFDAIEAYLDIDVAQPWVSDEKARKVADAIVENDHGVEWDGTWVVDGPNRRQLPYFVKARASDAPRVRSREEMFAQMIEAAIRR
ncbi:hypothetical protein Ctob_001286 [Chrysochromulina tobinii]|uniref:Uncharacterized protein n=1 Tax=Chrysochromulina tobinii TaxID=1460289 RepID=A0A0M0J639_9EUKA|nr:hypothetical protein Ctob_001286 [Chrysochromulina tobinii]|eukprot:KOO21688.1 hypothetical protein Ctob_001286 [Chrysochromulina sp. CCMP291]